MRPSIGLFFGSSTGNSAVVAKLIARQFESNTVDVYDISELKGEKFPKHTFYIMGISTWDGMDMQEDWLEFLSANQKMSFRGKKVAIYGLGDQLSYPDNFVDGMAHLYKWLVQRKAKVVGKWSTDGYNFNSSKAVVSEQFVGLVLDEDQQPGQTIHRIQRWTRQLIGIIENEKRLFWDRY